MAAVRKWELPLAALVVMAAALLGLRLAVGLFAEPMGDEAYYSVPTEGLPAVKSPPDDADSKHIDPSAETPEDTR